MAQFTYHYDHGIINTGDEIVDLAKSLGVIFHPINPASGKENIMMWQFASYAPIRGEPAIRKFVVDSKAIQDEVMVACNQHCDDSVQTDIDGMVIDVEANVIDMDLGVPEL
jgi:hypothetical protein